MREEYDAVFLAIGQAGVRALDLEGEALAGVHNAVDFIAALRQSVDKSALPVGRRVVVIGGGNTAVDAATQARRLGAEDVTIVYRRGPESMSATRTEQAWAQTNGVRIRHWATPRRFLSGYGGVAAVEFLRTHPGAKGESFTLEADMVLKAVGQTFDPLPVPVLEVAGGRIVVDARRQTSIPGIYAGGDCVAGADLTVSAVQDGKLAAEAIHASLSA